MTPDEASGKNRTPAGGRGCVAPAGAADADPGAASIPASRPGARRSSGSRVGAG